MTGKFALDTASEVWYNTVYNRGGLMITLKRGDVLISKAGRKYVVSHIKRRDDAEDRIKVYSPDIRMILNGSYTEKDLRAGVLTPTGEFVDLSERGVEEDG
jgi:hypothetical protein